ncbi:MAG: pteridine reductase [Gammaproteobacteria bacterium]|nr:pteridine reductase [Gammaproteobacteria bacterium]
MQKNSLTNKVALVTGAGRRIGAATVKRLHAEGMCVGIHYRASRSDAEQLATELNSVRPDSALPVAGDLNNLDDLSRLVAAIIERFERLDALVNNASAFYPTPVNQATLEQWEDLVGINMRAPFFLAQASAAALADSAGCIVNIVDIYAHRPLADHAIYCAAKAGLVALTRALARDLSPVRVNAVAPGAILWPDSDGSEDREGIIDRTPLQRMGTPDEIATTIVYLIGGATFVTGQVISVDGGRSLVP